MRVTFDFKTNRMFNKFEYFGSIADKETRQKVANAIFESIQKVKHHNIELLDEATENFSTAINLILANNTLRELCQKDPVLSEKVTLEMLDFINQAKRKVQVTDNPHTKESERLNRFSELAENELLAPQEGKNPYLTQFIDYLGSNYQTYEIQAHFYKEMFEKSLEPVENEAEKVEKQSFDSVKAHMTEKWKALLFAKQTKHELAIIDEARKKFCEDLYKRIEELKKLQEVLEPFNAMLGRLWDMSKGNWQRVNFDLLKQFAELLKRDKALAELAEMLGRMRQAEIEFETETFTNTVLKTEWKIEHARKEDLIGVYESDDLNNMLPSEAAFLSDPVLETIFYKKFVEKKLQTFEYESKSLSYKEEKFEDKRLKSKELDKGPFIICVDTSGSMHGTPELVAKTLCFAILKIAIQENRKCYLISFSTSIETLNLSDLKNSMEKLLQFLAMSFHGGTDATPAVQESLKMLQTKDYEKADVLMISDFVMSHFDAATKVQIQAAKAKKTKFHSLVIGSSQNQGVISDFDNTWIYDPNNRNAMITLMDNLSKMRKD
jgi:uncharacterized protein with von Willebrand factor type A (vWA) domain